jgi:cobalt-zinc-cadmium efflux system outer membrane protein
VGVLIYLAGAVAGAQSGAAVNPTLARAIDQARGLEVGAVIRLAFDRSPDLAGIQAMVAAAAGREQQAGLRSNPQTTVERREQIGGTDVTTSAGFSWMLDVGRLQPRRDAATAERQAVEFDRDEAKRQLAAAIRAAYGDVLAAARALTTTEAQIATASTILQLATERATAGSGPALDREQAAVEVSLLTRQRYRDELQLETDRLALAQLAGLGPTEAFSIRGALERAAEDAAAVSARPIAQADRSDLRAAATRLTAAQARTRSAQAEGRFDLGLFGQYMSMKSGFPQQAFSDQGNLVPVSGTFHTLVGGVTFTLPWFNRQQGAVRAATAEEAVAARQLDRARLAADHQVALGRLRVEKARAAAAVLRDEALTRARANVEVLKEAYALGSRTLSDVLMEVRRVQQIETEYTDALREWYQAGVALRTALGDVDWQ